MDVRCHLGEAVIRKRGSKERAPRHLRQQLGQDLLGTVPDDVDWEWKWNQIGSQAPIGIRKNGHRSCERGRRRHGDEQTKESGRDYPEMLRPLAGIDSVNRASIAPALQNSTVWAVHRSAINDKSGSQCPTSGHEDLPPPGRMAWGVVVVVVVVVGEGVGCGCGLWVWVWPWVDVFVCM